MANGHENLKPFNELTEDKQRELSRKGGIASGEARRKRKTLREELLLLLEQDNFQEKISLALLQKATSGDTKAFEVLRDTIGEKPVDKVETEVVSTIKVDVVDE